METQTTSAAPVQGHHDHHHRRSHDTGEGDRWRGKSGNSVGHRAKAMRAEGCDHGGGCRTQGALASSIARGIETGQAMVKAVYVNVSYTTVALSLTGQGPATGAPPVADETAVAAAEAVEPVAEGDALPAAEAVEPVAEGDALPATEVGATGAPESESAASGYQASFFYLEAQIRYTSASVALELLR